MSTNPQGRPQSVVTTNEEQTLINKTLVDPAITVAGATLNMVALADLAEGDGVVEISDILTGAPDETGTIYNGATALTPKFAVIAASSSGNNTLVAAVTGKKIRVVAYNLIANAAVNVKFQSGAGGTDLTGLKYCGANGGMCAPYNPVGWFETAASALLNLNLSSAIAVGGELVYIEV